MKRKHKSYSRPKRPFDKTRIEEEKQIMKDFGLKNKTELWKAEARIKKMREKAKKLVKTSDEEKKEFFDRLKKIGINVSSLADVLALDKKHYLERRLQTLVLRKNIAKSPREARQMIVHKKILINNKVTDSPSYIVPIELENKISLKEKANKKEVPEQEKSETAENLEKTNKEVKEIQAEVEGK